MSKISFSPNSLITGAQSMITSSPFCSAVCNAAKEGLKTLANPLASVVISLATKNNLVAQAILGGTMFAFGAYSLIRSGAPRHLAIKALNCILPSPNRAESSFNKKLALTGAIDMCAGVLFLSLASSRFQPSPAQETTPSQFLVCHDNKPSEDKKAGRPYARLGVVDLPSNNYTRVAIPSDDPLAQSRDLESLQKTGDQSYLACESKGRCFAFNLEKNSEGYTAFTERTLSLPTPEKGYTNIEAIALQEDGSLCYGNRESDNTWIRYSKIDPLNSEITITSERVQDSPYPHYIREERALVDMAIGQTTGTEYFVAATDYDGEQADHSFIYTPDGQRILDIPGHKVEALYLSPDEKSAILATDDETKGSSICRANLVKRTVHCSKILDGQEFGISGMVVV